MNPSRLREILFDTDIFPWLRWHQCYSARRGYQKRAFLHQLSSCVNAGFDLPRSLEICLKEAVPRGMRRALNRARNAVEEGNSLSIALRTHAPNLLPKSFYGVIEIGEKSGILADTLKTVDKQYADISMMRRKTVGVMLYPAQVLLVCIGIVTFLLVKVVPTFAEIYSDMGTKMPRPTQVMIALSHLIRSHEVLSWVVLACVLLALLGFVLLARWVIPLSRVVLRIPFFGPLASHANMLSLSSLLSMLLQAGMPTREALALCENDAVWPIFRDAIGRMGRDVSEGKAFSEALAAESVFSPAFLWFASVGEQRGDLADSLKAFSEYERNQIRDTTAKLQRIFEPTIIIVMGLVMGSMIVAMWLPILGTPQLLL